MKNEHIISDFVNRTAPEPSVSANEFVRHTLTSLSRFLNTGPDEVVGMAEAGLLQAEEVFPGAPSLRFSTTHLHRLRREIALTHALDAIELCAAKSDHEAFAVIELSWKARGEKVVELCQKLSKERIL